MKRSRAERKPIPQPPTRRSRGRPAPGPAPGIVKIGLIQATVRRTQRKHRKTLDLASAAAIGRANHLHPGTVPIAIFLPDRRIMTTFALPEPVPGPSTEAFQKLPASVKS